MDEKTYICVECGFHGTDDNFERHVLSPAHDYGHNNCAPEEVELQCPQCSSYEDESIVEAGYCDYCQSWQPEESISKDADGVCICAFCRVKQSIMKGDHK